LKLIDIPAQIESNVNNLLHDILCQPQYLVVEEDEFHPWARAMFDLRLALFEVFRWRAGEAHRRVYAEAVQ